MCQQVAAINTANKMKASYSIKQVLKMFFKKQHSHNNKQRHHQPHHKMAHSLESLESVDNLRNAQAEEVYYAEIDENVANEKLAELVAEQQQQQQAVEQDIYVPVRFARTTAGTFFWTTNLQPVSSSVVVQAADEDLLQPAYCYTSQQYAYMQYQDRWVQA